MFGFTVNFRTDTSSTYFLGFIEKIFRIFTFNTFGTIKEWSRIRAWNIIRISFRSNWGVRSNNSIETILIGCVGFGCRWSALVSVTVVNFWGAALFAFFCHYIEVVGGVSAINTFRSIEKWSCLRARNISFIGNQLGLSSWSYSSIKTRWTSSIRSGLVGSDTVSDLDVIDGSRRTDNALFSLNVEVRSSFIAGNTVCIIIERCLKRTVGNILVINGSIDILFNNIVHFLIAKDPIRSEQVCLIDCGW